MSVASTPKAAQEAGRPDPDLHPVFAAERRFLWGLCYRMTGCAADADDLVQETFLRAMERPPARTDEPWRPWLVRVSLNLGRDLLRRRRRRGYVGPWLPSPIDTEEDPPSYEVPAERGLSTEGRYELLESVSFAFLLALEALTPQQRAVLLLRDVFDYSVADTAGALGISEANVKTTHHRARRAMQDYDARRRVPTRDLQDKTRDALTAFLGALLKRDVASIENLLTADVRTLHDGAGEFLAARKPVAGRDRVKRLYLGLTEGVGKMPPSVLYRTMNGVPAVVLEFPGAPPRVARRMVIHVDVDAAGRIHEIHMVLASRKLTAVRFGQG